MAEPDRCPTCGHPVRVVGKTTLHYEPDEHEQERLLRVWAEGEQRKREQAEEGRLVARSEARQVREVLRTLHMAVANVGGGPLHDLYQHSDLRNLVERALEG